MPTPVKAALGAILLDPEARGKPCGVFGSFGWVRFVAEENCTHPRLPFH